MKLIIENFRKFLTEQNFISGIPLETDEEGNVILYHVSGAEDIEELDPDVAKETSRTIQQQNTEVGIDQEFFFYSSRTRRHWHWTDSRCPLSC